MTGDTADYNQFCSLFGSANSLNFWGVDLGNSYQIQTIFFSANEEVGMEHWNTGLEFRIGNVSTTPTSNPVCFTTTYPYSQWISIQASGACTG